MDERDSDDGNDNDEDANGDGVFRSPGLLSPSSLLCFEYWGVQIFFKSREMHFSAVEKRKHLIGHQKQEIPWSKNNVIHGHDVNFRSRRNYLPLYDVNCPTIVLKKPYRNDVGIFCMAEYIDTYACIHAHVGTRTIVGMYRNLVQSRLRIVYALHDTDFTIICAISSSINTAAQSVAWIFQSSLLPLSSGLETVTKHDRTR